MIDWEFGLKDKTNMSVARDVVCMPDLSICLHHSSFVQNNMKDRRKKMSSNNSDVNIVVNR